LGLIAAAAMTSILFTVAWSSAGDSIPDHASFEGRPIVSIELSGPTAPSAETFEQQSPLRVGRAYSAVAIRRAVDKLIKTGDWTDIRVDADPRDHGVALSLSFTPVIRINAVEFHGHRQRTAALRQAAGLRPGDEATDAAIAAAASRLRDWYDRFAYVVEITPRTAFDARGTQARVTFEMRERDRLRLRDITFPGTPAFSTFRHLVALRTAPGEYASREHLERGLDRLRRLYQHKGYLSAVIGPLKWTTTPRGLTVAVPIQQGTRYRVEVVGFDDKTITTHMTLFDDPRDDDDSLAEEGERLAHYLSDRGYRRAVVRLERRAPPDGVVVIRVAVNAGPRFPLTAVEITGNIAASDRELHDLLATKPGGRWRARYIQQAALDDDRHRIQAWYRAHGFLAAAVTADAREADVPPGATAVFAVDEGPQTRIGLITLDGREAVSLDEILTNYDLREGSPYVEARVRAARAAMLERYSEHGFLYTTINATPVISVDRTRADLGFRIVEGPSVVVGDISLSGNERTDRHVILRELDVRSGDVYNPRRIFENQRRVAQLGFLREVRLEPEDPERVEAVKALRLSVKERNAGSADIGAGYSNYEGARGFGEITYRNLWGLGRRAGLRIEGSRIERKAVMSYRHPWLFDQRIDGKTALFHEVREEETRNYQRSTYGMSVGVDRTLRPRLFGSLVYNYQINDLEVLDPNTTQNLLPFDQDRSNIGSLTPSLVWNTRDDLFNPRTGVVATVAVESAALLLGSQEQFWKVTAGTSRFIPLSKPVVLAVGTRTGVASRFGETQETLIQNAPPGTDIRIPLLLPPTERFYVGGRSSIRGYDEDTVGPELGGTPIGGNVFLLLNAELRVTVVGSLGIVAFWDGGNAWLDPDDIRWTDIKTTVGLGLRYNTPVGPLRLDYGYKLNRLPRPPDPDGNGALEQPPREAPGTFHFTLGHAF
jgi:outer membrane protein insertion porin family